jgi:hypothetical protein
MAPTPTTAGPSKQPKRKTVALVVGTLLVLAASVALFWNEWRSASRNAALVAGERGLVEIGIDRVPAAVPSGLVHLGGPARPSGAIADPIFPVREAALRLDRIVEMYQWREHREGSGDNRTYRYERVWAEGRIASERFRAGGTRINPAAPAIASVRLYPDEVAIGTYALAPALIDLLPASAVVTVPPPGEVFLRSQLLRADGTGYTTTRGAAPEIGDVRVRFRAVPAGTVSVLGGLDGSVLRPWRAPGGGAVALAEPGLVTPQAMLGKAYRSNALQTWAIRLAATVALFVGLSLMLSALRRTSTAIAGWKARLEARLALPLAVSLAVAWGVVVIALAWLLFRPLMSMALVAASVALFSLLVAFAGRRPAAGGSGNPGGAD